MNNVKAELVSMLNAALKLEHQARIQYLTHAEMVKGLYAEPIIERLRELAGDEAKHEDKFRYLIANCLDAEPTMEISETHSACEIQDILNINLHDEKTALDLYKNIYNKIVENKDQFKYEFETLEHEIRHIIIDEQEHVIELKTLIG